jgi:hypothetical protein
MRHQVAVRTLERVSLNRRYISSCLWILRVLLLRVLMMHVLVLRVLVLKLVLRI